MSQICRVCWGVVLSLFVTGNWVIAQDAATAKEALAVGDLTKLPRFKPMGNPLSNSPVTQSYNAEGGVSDVTGAIQAEVEKGGWSVVGTPSITDAYAAVVYQKQGFSLSLTVTPNGQPNSVMVVITNHGNVNVEKLEIVDGLKKVYASPSMGIFNSDATAEETREKLLARLESAGWELFGDTTVSFYVKKNAVRMQVMVTPSPTEEGKSSVHFSCEQLSVDVAAPKDVEQLQYTESPAQLSFQGKQSLEYWVDYFRKSFESAGWKATTENTVRIDFKEHLIFRNPQQEMVECEFRGEEGKTGVLVRWLSAEQVKRDSEMADAAIAKAKQQREQAMRDKEAAKVTVTFEVPEGLKVTDSSATSIELSAQSGKAKGAIIGWLREQKAAGWSIKAVVDTKEIAEYELTRGAARMSVSIVDPGFIPASITLTIDGDNRLEVKQGD